MWHHECYILSLPVVQASPRIEQEVYVFSDTFTVYTQDVRPLEGCVFLMYNFGFSFFYIYIGHVNLSKKSDIDSPTVTESKRSSKWLNYEYMYMKTKQTCCSGISWHMDSVFIIFICNGEAAVFSIGWFRTVFQFDTQDCVAVHHKETNIVKT